MYLCHNLNGDATQKIDTRRRRGLVVADRVRTVTFSAGGLSSFDICCAVAVTTAESRVHNGGAVPESRAALAATRTVDAKAKECFRGRKRGTSAYQD